jgi:hypothetical protein
MNRRTTLLCLCVVMAFPSLRVAAQVGVLPKKDVTLKESTDEKFRVGDVWEYQTRKGEEHSRITILRVDESPELGTIIHVGIDNVRLANCHGGPEPEAVPHMPFARKALEESVAKKVASDQPLPDYKEGYQEWRRAYVQKHAGIYVISVANAVSVAEKTFQNGIGCDQASSR